MQQIALNLIAIGVFLVTLSALLGPLLHLSPTIPATITLGIMGLVTVDTLGWQSRGVTLLLDSLAPSQYRQRVVRHEAGHFLAAFLLGIPITGYALTAWEAWRQGYPGLAGVRFDTEALFSPTIDVRENNLILERFCPVWLAGIAAEKLVYGDAQGGREDRQKVQSALLAAGFPESLCQQKASWALLQGKNLLEKHQKSYQALVKEMDKRASVAECYRVIMAVEECPALSG